MSIEPRWFLSRLDSASMSLSNHRDSFPIDDNSIVSPTATDCYSDARPPEVKVKPSHARQYNLTLQWYCLNAPAPLLVYTDSLVCLFTFLLLYAPQLQSFLAAPCTPLSLACTSSSFPISPNATVWHIVKYIPATTHVVSPGCQKHLMVSTCTSQA